MNFLSVTYFKPVHCFECCFGV